MLNTRQRIMLEALAQGPIFDDIAKRVFYRLGGHGDVPLRYHPFTLPSLHELGYATRKGSRFYITEAGRGVLQDAGSAMKADTTAAPERPDISLAVGYAAAGLARLGKGGRPDLDVAAEEFRRAARECLRLAGVKRAA